MALATISSNLVQLPALSSAHSHAFQRAMRGTAQRRGSDPNDDFWSWRGQMYRAASSLTPESIFEISRIAFRELFNSGVRTVGEFHYIHHQENGAPYENRTLLSERVVEAAKQEGLRVSLLRVAYHRAGPGREREKGQRRFCDESVDDVLRDIDALRIKYQHDPMVRVGVAPHSIRAVPPVWLKPLHAYATMHRMPFHMHVAEQQREIDECVAETGKRPVELFADLGILDERFVAVHATNLADHEVALMGKARAFACICPTTERDLGDGLGPIAALRAAGARLCTGIDSHVITDPIDDLRSLETHERLRTRTRVTFSPTDGTTPAEQLWHEGSIAGELACGFQDKAEKVSISREHPALHLVKEEGLIDAIVFSGNASLFQRT